MMSSHLPDHALLYSNRVALMKNGRFIALGNPNDVISEDNLSATYDTDVRILSADDSISGEKIKFCIPSNSISSQKCKTIKVKATL